MDFTTRMWQSFDVFFFFTEYALPVLHVASGHPRLRFDIFTASGEYTAWVVLWKTLSRPIGVRVCPVAQLNFFSTAFDLREWTIVVLGTSAPTFNTWERTGHRTA